jgi:hypothetical protein
MTNDTAIIQTRQDAQRALNQQPIHGAAVLLRGRWFVTRPSEKTWCLHRMSPWYQDRMEKRYCRGSRIPLDIVFGAK